MVNVTFVYQDNSTWYAGQFATEEEANKWVEEEKERPYWKESTVVQIEVLPDPPPLQQPE